MSNGKKKYRKGLKYNFTFISYKTASLQAN